MEFVKECSQSELADKSHVKALMGMLTTCKFNGTHIIRQHVTKMIDIAAKLGSMGMEVRVSLYNSILTPCLLSLVHFK